MTNHEQDFLNVEEVVVDTTAPTADEAAQEAADTRTWTLEDGTEVSKSEFIREQFTKFNKSRKDIATEYDINYRTVYGATVNMVNDAEPSTRGRAASNQKIMVDAEGNVVSEIEGVLHVNNVASDAEYAEGDLQEVDRNTFIKEQVEAGKSRGDVAAALGLSYGVVYGLTKEIAGASNRHEVEYNGEMVSRSEYIRARYAEGVEKADIAKELGVDYPVVWSALKALKSDQEKFADAVDRLAKYADKVENSDELNGLLEQLKGLEFKSEGSEEEAEATEEA